MFVINEIHKSKQNHDVIMSAIFGPKGVQKKQPKKTPRNKFLERIFSDCANAFYKTFLKEELR